MKRRQDFIVRITNVEREHQAAAIAAGLLADRLRADPSFLAPVLRARDGEAVQRNIESTYFIRLFAVFEAGLREAWSNALGQKTEPPARNLIVAVATRRSIPDNLTQAVHEVRFYRNALVHGGDAEQISISDARRRLNRFFARLPEDW